MNVVKLVKIKMLLCIIPAFLFLGCNTSKMMVDSMNPMIDKMSMGVNKNGDVDVVKDSMPYSLVYMDGLLEVSPDNEKLLVAAAEAYSGYSFCFVQDNDRKRASKLYLKSRNYALRVLKKDKHFKEALDKPFDEFVPTLDEFDKEDVPALFFAANSWLQYIVLNLDNMEFFLDIPKIEAMFLKVIELDETYYYGSAHMALGAYYSAQSKALGGNLEKGKRHFDKAFQISESKYLLAYFLYARFYAVQTQDKELFVKSLDYIIKAPEDILPDKVFVNNVMKRKAKRLLGNVDKLF